MLIDQPTGRQIIWGFLLENTYFTEFDKPNHAIIERAYSQRKKKQASHYIVIRDSHLASPARIYFGVAQVHLRMPGTRYYVRRNLSRPQSAVMLFPTQSISNENVFSKEHPLPADFSLINPCAVHQFSDLPLCCLPSPPASRETNFPSFPDFNHELGQTDSNGLIGSESWSALMDPIFWCVSQENYPTHDGSFYSIV